MTSPVRVLLVEDSADDAALLVRELCRGGYDPLWERVDTETALRAALARQEWDLITCDWVLPGFDASEALRLIQGLGGDVPIIIVSGEVAEEVAVTAMRAGASDFVSKQRLARLVPAVARELRDAEGRRARQRAEAELRRTQHLEAVAQLASGVAHYFNNQLTVIKGAAQFLLSELPASDARRLDAELVSTTADRCARMVDQLTLFGRREPQDAPSLNLNTVVHELAPTLQGLLGKHIALRVRTATDLRLVCGHRGQIEHAVLQLVANARDALAPVGKAAMGDAVTIETANVEADQTSGAAPVSGPHVLLAVSDNGPGIAPDVRKRLFEPFFTTKTVGQGTGLGLATVFGIVRHHKGSIVCLSELGQGAAFRVYLPAAGAQ